jgi:GH24 family phage-related lysozyme (muramidase)
MNLLPDSYLTDFRSRTSVFEGRIPHQYLDGLSNVTCGVGHLLATAHDAELIKWTGLFTPGAATAEWTHLKSTPGLTVQQCEECTRLRMSDAVMDDLLDNDIGDKQGDLLLYVPDVMDFPAPARQVLLDFSFNVGASRLKAPAPRGWPSMMAAIRARDWAKAAAESARNGIQQARNDYAAQLLLSCAHSV